MRLQCGWYNKLLKAELGERGTWGGWCCKSVSVSTGNRPAENEAQRGYTKTGGIEICYGAVAFLSMSQGWFKIHGTNWFLTRAILEHRDADAHNPAA
jgi:hypothetical protein